MGTPRAVLIATICLAATGCFDPGALMPSQPGGRGGTEGPGGVGGAAGRPDAPATSGSTATGIPLVTNVDGWLEAQPGRRCRHLVVHQRLRRRGWDPGRRRLPHSGLPDERMLDADDARAEDALPARPGRRRNVCVRNVGAGPDGKRRDTRVATYVRFWAVSPQLSPSAAVEAIEQLDGMPTVLLEADP